LPLFAIALSHGLNRFDLLSSCLRASKCIAEKCRSLSLEN
jgi:hypothetical protein